MPPPEQSSTGPAILPATSAITLADRWDHFLVRIGVNRMDHQVEPGLYALGSPTPDSPVFVTANYTLSFDALRASLPGMDSYILVLDTDGINVWCAAGKGSFGTDELVNRIEVTNLKDVVNHRVIILPQLGAPGIVAHEVRKRSKFKVEYGPVRASDLPEYMKTRQATPEMRKIRFPLLDRAVLIPVDFGYGLPAVIWMIAAILLTQWLDVGYASRLAAAFLAAILSGIVLFPLLLPWLPTKDFVTQGFILGCLVTLPFVFSTLQSSPTGVTWQQIGIAIALMLVCPPVTAYVSFNFTGATTFTSRSRVGREIEKYIPIIVWMFIIGIVLNIALFPFVLFGGVS